MYTCSSVQSLCLPMISVCIVYTCMLLVLQSTPMSVHTGGEGGGKAEVPSIWHIRLDAFSRVGNVAIRINAPPCAPSPHLNPPLNVVGIQRLPSSWSSSKDGCTSIRMHPHCSVCTQSCNRFPNLALLLLRMQAGLYTGIV